MPLSAWNIWLHPRRAAHQLEELQTLADENGSLRHLLEQERAKNADLIDNAAGKAEEFRQLNEDKNKLEADVRRLSSSLKTASEELGERNKELENARYELGYRRDTETQLREFEKTLERVEVMKMNYERRIRVLRDTVTNLKRRLDEQEETSDELAVIDMTTGKESTDPAPVEKEKSGDDWLMSLPEL